MNTIYKKNFNLISENHNYLLDNIVENNSFNRFQICSHNNYITNIYDKKNNLYAHHNISEEVSKLNSIDFSSVHLFFIKSLDSGIYIKSIIANYPHKIIVVVEKDIEYFNFLINSIDFTDVLQNKNVLFLIDKELDEINILIERKFGLLMYKNIQFIENKIRSKLHFDYYENATKYLNVLIDTSQTNYYTIKKFSYEWDKNILYNLNRYLLYKDISFLYSSFNNVPCVLVCAGTSLDDNLVYLKQVQNKCIIISVDTAARTLVNNNITPDFIISIDSQNINYNYLKGLSFSKTFLIATPLVQPATYELFKNNVFVFNYGHSLLNYIDKITNVKSDTSVIGSVSSCALDISARLGFAPIILLGCDFGFKSFYTHSKEAMSNIMTSVNLNKFITYETYCINRLEATQKIDGYSGEIYTNTDFISWKNWFEMYIEQTNLPVINCSQDGAVLKNVKFEYFKNIIDKFDTLQFNAYEKIKKIFLNASSKSIIQQFSKEKSEYNTKNNNNAFNYQINKTNTDNNKFISENQKYNIESKKENNKFISESQEYNNESKKTNYKYNKININDDFAGVQNNENANIIISIFKSQLLDFIINTKKKIEIVDKRTKKYHDKRNYYFKRCYDMIEDLVYSDNISSVFCFEIKLLLFENDYNVSEKLISDLIKFFEEKLSLVNNCFKV